MKNENQKFELQNTNLFLFPPFLIVFIITAISIFYLSFFAPFEAVAVQGTVNITGTVPGCGDGIIQSGESCDGSNLNNKTCSTQGFSGGTLSCNSNCTFNTSQCTSAPPSGGGGGGGGGWGGGGGGYIPPPQTAVNFSGKAYPKSTVTLLKDAQVAATVIADTNANFQISLSGLSSGNFIFSVYSEDSKGNRSSLLTFPVSVTSGATTTINGIFIAPTIAVDKSEVKRGDNLAIFGQSAPAADIIIAVGSDQEIFAKTASDKDGVYLYNLDTSVLDYGGHIAKSKAAIASQLISGFSQAVSFKVSEKTVAREPAAKCGKADLDCDGRVNLIDFSILAYWYKRSNPPAIADLNGDGKVDLVDFSIMAYYWTG